jgi:acyl-CoA synthetase (AMP-forming)/AMP-acid ligase II
MNLGLAVATHAVRSPDRLAVDDGRGRTLTYRQLHERSNRLAHVLVDGHGVKPGDRVAYLMRNRLEAGELLLGVWKAGAIVVALNFRLSEKDLLGIWQSASPTVMLTEPEFEPAVREVARELGTKVVVLNDDYERVLLSASDGLPGPVLHTTAASDALIAYTSGTTGRPKGATFTHEALLFHAANVAIEYQLSATSRWLVDLPHNSAITLMIVPSFYIGGAVVLPEIKPFDGAEWLRRVDDLAATHGQVVPTMLYRVLEASRDRRRPMKTMRMLGYGSAPIPPERVRELVDSYGYVFTQIYGMVETCAIGTMLRPDEHRWALEEAPGVLASVGQASYGMKIRVVDDRGDDCAEGASGEVLFKSPYMMRGYWDAPEATAQTIRDGWLHSGDVGVVRDGWLYLVDRIKDLIIRGGQNIATKEVEEAIYQHAGVIEAGVFGVPDAEWGEAVMAAVVVRPGVEATEADILATCRAQGLSSFKLPSHIAFVSELPRNGIGKIQKMVLRETYGPQPT